MSDDTNVTDVEPGELEPSYELPEDVPRDEPATPPSEPSQEPAAEPPTEAPAAQATETPAPPADAALLSHPAIQAILEQNRQLTALLQQQRQQEQATATTAPPPPRPQEDIALEERMIERIPFLGRVREFMQAIEGQRLEHLLSLADAAPQVQQTFSTHAERVADAAFQQIVGTYAQARGVDPSAVDPRVQQRLVKAFEAEVTANPALSQRFKLGDLSVVGEVMGDMLSMYGLSLPRPHQAPPAAPPAAPPVVPQNVVGIAQRAARAQSLPRPNAALPSAPPPPAGSGEDEDDAIHGLGWAELQSMTGR